MKTIRKRESAQDIHFYMTGSERDSFTYIRTEKEPPYDDIVRVECSPYGMAHWALQYSELVEILEPESLREDIKSKIKALNEKYSL